MRGLTAMTVARLQPRCTVLGPIDVPIGGPPLRGELVSLPHAPQEMLDGRSDARNALVNVLDCAEHREARFVSLWALIPSISRQGRLLKEARPHMAITTGHATLRCMFRRSPRRRVLAIELPQQMSKIPEIPGWNPIDPGGQVWVSGNTDRVWVPKRGRS